MPTGTFEEPWEGEGNWLPLKTIPTDGSEFEGLYAPENIVLPRCRIHEDCIQTWDGEDGWQFGHIELDAWRPQGTGDLGKGDVTITATRTRRVSR